MWLLATALAGPPCPPDPSLSHAATLYLGADRDGRPYVGPARWARYLREVVAPAFPGFTVLEGRGWWEGASERTRLLVVFHDPAQDGDIDTIAEAYRTRFGQEATLVVDAPVEARMCVGGA